MHIYEISVAEFIICYGVFVSILLNILYNKKQDVQYTIKLVTHIHVFMTSEKSQFSSARKDCLKYGVIFPPQFTALLQGEHMLHVVFEV